jgi:hypothetical protein
MKDTANATNLFGVPPPPQGGNSGQRVTVRTNMFEIRYPKESRWHHYDGKRLAIPLREQF